MKSFKTLPMEYPEAASQMAYDHHSQTLVVSGPKLALISEKGKEDIPFIKSQNIESIALPKDQQADSKPYLHFLNQNNDQLWISYSGILKYLGFRFNINLCRDSNRI